MTGATGTPTGGRTVAFVGTAGMLGLSTENARVLLLLLLTFVTGSVDAVSYLGLDRVFTANMTGNLALMGFAASGAAHLPLVRSASALLAFLAGAVLAGRAVRLADVRATWPLPVTACICASVALLTGVFGWWMVQGRAPNPDLLASVLALAMGIQGAATRKLGVADLPTTVVTSTLTGLAADSLLAGGPSVRWRRRAGAVCSLLLGAVVGGLLVKVDPPLGLLPALAVLLLAAGIITAGRLHRPMPQQ